MRELESKGFHEYRHAARYLFQSGKEVTCETRQHNFRLHLGHDQMDAASADAAESILLHVTDASSVTKAQMQENKVQQSAFPGRLIEVINKMLVS